MKKRTCLIAALVALAALTAVTGCAKYTIVPPAIDLMAYADLGMVAFRAEGVEGDLGGLAAQLFLEEVTRAQRVPVVELGAPAEVLGKIGRPAFDRDAAKALGEEYGVRSCFLGEVAISKVKPQIDLAAPSVKSLFVRATFDIAMTVRLVSTESGATIWTESIRREGTVGALSMGPNGIPTFGIRDKNEAMHSLLREMSYQLTWDFRPTRRRL